MGKTSDWLRRATSPSGSRWGISSFFVSVSLFLLALSPSFYAVYLSFAGGTLVPPVDWLPSLALIAAIITGMVGVVIGLSVFVLGVWWLFHPADGDATGRRLARIEREVCQIKRMLRSRR